MLRHTWKIIFSKKSRVFSCQRDYSVARPLYLNLINHFWNVRGKYLNPILLLRLWQKYCEKNSGCRFLLTLQSALCVVNDKLLLMLNTFVIMNILYYTRPNFKNWRFKYYKKACYSAIREKITKRQKMNFNIFIFYEFKYEFNKPGFVKRSEFIWL